MLEQYVELELFFSLSVAAAGIKANPLISSTGFLLAHPIENSIFKYKLHRLYSYLAHYLHKNKTSPWYCICSAKF